MKASALVFPFLMEIVAGNASVQITSLVKNVNRFLLAFSSPAWPVGSVLLMLQRYSGKLFITIFFKVNHAFKWGKKFLL